MAQLRLDDLRQFTGTDSLPARGLLSLFYVAQPFSASCREELDAARVYHFFDVDLGPSETPADAAISPVVWEISFAQIWSMPDDEFHYSAQGLYAGLPDEEREQLREALIEIGDVGRPMQLLGYPSRQQGGCLQLQCERLTRELTWADIASPSAELRAAAAEWELLAQVTMDWRPVFEHDGYLHYWIRRTDLENGDFSRVCFTFERT